MDWCGDVNDFDGFMNIVNVDAVAIVIAIAKPDWIVQLTVQLQLFVDDVPGRYNSYCSNRYPKT